MNKKRTKNHQLIGAQDPNKLSLYHCEYLYSDLCRRVKKLSNLTHQSENLFIRCKKYIKLAKVGSFPWFNMMSDDYCTIKIFKKIESLSTLYISYGISEKYNYRL